MIGKLAITPFALRGLVRITAKAGTFNGEQMVEVEFVGNHPYGYVAGSKGSYSADSLTIVEPAADSFCRYCGWWGHHADLIRQDDCYCPKCYETKIASIPFEAYELPEDWVPF